MKLYKFILASHATYILLTGVWPLLDIKSFMLVTGPKTDIWLVKTVGALLIPVSLSMFSYLKDGSEKLPVIILGAGTAISFICIDVYYSLSDTISDIYLADAALEFIFLFAWIYILLTRSKS
jgi:hypothetical protein